MLSLRTFRKSRWLALLAAALLLVTSFGSSFSASASGTKAPSATSASLSPVVASPTQDDGELFGIVARDPFYEYNTDPANYPNQPNKAALEQQASELASAGARWIRMEFFADYDGSVQAGDINWSKYDWFIKELAPKYNLKVLALLNVGMVSYQGQTVRTVALNDPPDGAGSDPTDGSNHFIRVFSARAQAIAARYGTAISAYELINEPNISWDLWIDSHNGGAEMKPERYAALMANAYHAIKSVNADAQVILGGMLVGSPPEGLDRHDQFDYLYQLYTSPWTARYAQSGDSSRPGWNVVPWDGVALHPYFLETDKLFPLLKDFARKVRDRGDSKSKLWITEIGAEAKPPIGHDDDPSKDEVAQATYLHDVYSGILSDPELKANVPHVFWFKYEDFVPGDYSHNYGLVRLEEAPGGKAYSPSGKVWVHKLAYKAYQELARGGSLTDPTDPAQAQANNQVYFPETGQAIAPQFYEYWLERGGIERFGYPISRPIPLNGYLSQFFERAIFEYHPEYDGTPNSVLLRLVGNEFTKDRGFDKANPDEVPADRTYYPQTGHTLGGAFAKYWNENGGLAVFGYPISEEIQEKSPTDGQVYTVQYFERNRFEYHPEAAGTKYEVQLGLLGANLLKTNMWWR